MANGRINAKQIEGIVSTDNGGTNNNTFTASQVLIYGTNSIVSSGYIFNDSGTSSTDIWSAGKILSSVTGTTGSTGATGASGSLPNGAILEYAELYANTTFTTTLSATAGAQPWVTISNANMISGDINTLTYNGLDTISVPSSGDVKTYRFILILGCQKGEGTGNGVDIGVALDGVDPTVGMYTSIPTAAFTTTSRELSVGGMFTLSAGSTHSIQIRSRQSGGGAASTNSIQFNTLNLSLQSVSAITAGSTGATGATGSIILNGLTSSAQYLTASNDTNVNLNIISSGSTHSYNLSWNGILPIDRGGLGTSSFTASQILIMNSATTSIVSSGYIFNDSGTSSTDIWSADKVISYGKSGSFVRTTGDTMTGGLTAPSISIGNYIDFNITATPSHQEGRIYWDDNSKTLSIDTSDTNVDIRVGMSNLVYVNNQLASTLSKGTVVYINGGSNNKPTVATASYEDELRSASTIGFIASDIISGQNGYVITYGLLENINTNAYTPGTALYLGSNGSFTSTEPIAPLHAVRLGKVIRQSATVGTIYVSIQNGYELDELHDVTYIGTPSNNSVLQYISSNSRWENVTNPNFNDVVINGSLSVLGTSSTIYTQDLFIEDNKITLNATFSGSPILDSGIEINRGSSSSATILWNESIDYWQVGLSGSESTIITESGAGLTKTNNILSVSYSNVVSNIQGNGLTANGNQLDINVSSDSLEIVNDVLRLKDTISGGRIFTNGLTVSGYGLNTNTWTASQILTINSTTNSVIGSGYIFNDSGTSSTDVWSANKIISYVGTNQGSGTSSGVSSINGLTQSTQYFTASNDTNVTLNISSIGSTHSYNVGWSGILPVSRGGLGTSSFTASQILIMNSATTSIVSSGYIFNDSGTGLFDIWSASKIENRTQLTQLYLDKEVGRGVAGSTPTSSASTTSILTAVGLSFWTYIGTGNTIYTTAWSFQVPSNYVSGGAFRIKYTTETGTGVVKYSVILTSKNESEALQTVTESGLSATMSAVTSYNLATSPTITPSTATFSSNKLVNIRIDRNPADAADTFTNSSYIIGVIFEYTGTR